MKVTSRNTDVFFYGLFMDMDLLRSKGLNPQNAQRASIDGLALRIGKRAALVPALGHRVYGVVATLTLKEIERLYSEPSVQAYKPQAVLARLETGDLIAALCYNLDPPPAATERNPEYAHKLRELALKVGLPRDYVDSIG